MTTFARSCFSGKRAPTPPEFLLEFVQLGTHPIAPRVPPKQEAANHSAPGLWALLDRTPRDCWPSLLRGDKGFGNEGIMGEAERRASATR